MGSFNVSAGCGSVLGAEHLWWCPVTGTRSVPSPCGITQHITPTQNGWWTLWSAANVRIWTISEVTVKGASFSSSGMPIRNGVDFSCGSDQLILAVLIQWSESSTWTAGETMPYPGKAVGKILPCFDTCWWFVAVLRASGQSYVTSAKVWELGLQPLAFYWDREEHGCTLFKPYLYML